LNLTIERNQETTNKELLLFVSKNELVSSGGQVNLNNIDNSVVRTIDIGALEENYLATYLHPDTYYFTVFSDEDNNGYPSTGDFASLSTLNTVNPETLATTEISITILIP